MKSHEFALMVGNFVLFMIMFRDFWALRFAPDSQAFADALHGMGLPAFGMLSVGYATAPSLERVRPWAEALSFVFFVASAVVLIMKHSAAFGD